MTTAFTSSQLMMRIATRYAPPGYALFEQVKDTVQGARRADAIAVAMWASRGFEVCGFEIKTNRADWLRELDRPGKADPIARQCNRWWIVAPTDVVQPNELPSTWGLLRPRGDSLFAQVRAPLNVHADDLDRHFIVSILRSAWSTWAPQPQQEALTYAERRGHGKGYTEGRKSAEDDVKRAQENATAIQQRIAAFEEASGIPLSWNAPRKIGDAVKLVMGGRARIELDRLRSMVGRIAAEVDQAIDSLPPEAP